MGKRKPIKESEANLAEREYRRLVDLYRKAGAEETVLAINDEWIRKTAEVYAILERMKDLPTLIYSKSSGEMRETPAGKARVKYMAQYQASMQKLNKELLGSNADDDTDGLDAFL